jgi:putative copper resistance protein D
MVNGPLVVVRALHFAATAMTAGMIIFLAVVVEHAFRRAGADAKSFQTQMLRIAWIGLATTAASGVVWVLLQATAMSGLSFGQAMAPAVLWTVMSDTHFGIVSDIRLALAALLATALAYSGSELGERWLPPASAAGLVVALAWTGHAAGTLGRLGPLHLTADALHLLAAAVWLGALLPLAMLLAMARWNSDHEWALIARDATRRFSILGIASVGTLLATGIVNAWILVGSFKALTTTEYGRLLVGKIALFAAMLVIAAVNWLRLTPRLVLSPESQRQRDALHQLTRNSVIEITLGLTIFAIVGALGTLHPAIHTLPP